ncbi:hypothetical protein EFR01_36210 [Sinorhizobium fredii]|nr:hypothetical protein EFR01_36210 [Sinorhizobium fredii]GLS11941.1 hypothetical protein GCM10007864_55730 [Sinorhizobium fredii]
MSRPIRRSWCTPDTIAVCDAGELRFALEPAAVQLALKDPDSDLPDELDRTVAEFVERAGEFGKLRERD